MFNLTSSERKTLFFTIVVLIVSGVYQLIQPNNTIRKVWDYSESDSAFKRLSKVKTSPKTISDKKVESDSASAKDIKSSYSGGTKNNPEKKKVKQKLLPASININNATNAELQKLPRIGPAMANRIIEYRNKHGDFKTTKDLVKVKGIGNKTLEKLLPYIKVK